MSEVLGIAGSNRQIRIGAVASAWRAATSHHSFIPLPQGEVREIFERLSAEALDALRADEPAEATRQRGQSIGRGLTGLNLLKPKTLEATLTCLDEELAGLSSPEKLGYLLAGIAGGFAGAMESALLAQQEAVSQASTLALRRTQIELETSRDSLAAANLELSEQVAERTRAEELQRDLAERLQRLHEIDLAILSADSLTAILDISLDQLQALIPAISIAITAIDIHTSRSTVLQSTSSAYPSGRELPITMTKEIERLGRGEVIYIADLNLIRDISPGVAEIADLGGRSLMALPLRYRDDLIGSLIIILGEVRLFSVAEVSIAHELAGSMAVAIQNRRLLEAEQASRGRETILREVAAALTTNMGLDELLTHILNQVDRVITSQSSAILLIDNEIPNVVAQRGIPSTPEQLNDLMNTQPLSLWAVLESAQPSIIDDTYASPDWTIVEGLEYIRSWLAVPLLAKGELIGILTMDRDESYAFTSEDMELALTFANQAAIAIDNARLFAKEQAHAGVLEKRVRERTRELEVLYGVTATAVRNPDMDSLLERSMELTADAFGCAAASVHLIEGEEVGLQLAALYERLNPSLSGYLRDLNRDAPCLIHPLQSGKPHVVTGENLPLEWERHRSLILISVPLRSRGRNQGVLCLLCETPDQLAGSAPELLTTIADQIGAAVENIRLHQIARQSAIIEERERLAREIHDQVTQSIYSAALFAEAARSAAEMGNLDKVQHHIQSSLRLSNQALRELRLLLFELRTEALARKGLVDALRERVKTVEHRAGIVAQVVATNVENLPVAIEETYYRIALEALNNALRHARADRVDIVLMVEEGDLIMTIVDNGIGFDQEIAARSGGMGLDGMQKRIGKVDGILTLSSNDGGTWVTARTRLEH